MRKREEAAKAATMHARWAAIRRRRMRTYPVLRRTVAVPFSEALIAESQDDPPACPPCGPSMTMAVSAPMIQAARRSVATAPSAVLGARGVVFVTRDRESWPDVGAVSTGKTQADAARGCRS